MPFCTFSPLYLSYWRSIAEAIANAIERPIERHIDNPRQKQSNSAPSLRSVVAALRDAQTFRGSAPSGFQGSDSLREPPPSFLTCALNGLVSKIHPRARPAKPDQPAFCNCATSRCGPLSLSRLLHRESRLVRFHLTRTQAVRPDASHPGYALNGLHQGRPEKFGLGAILPNSPRGLGEFLSGYFRRLRRRFIRAAKAALEAAFAAQSPLRYHSIFV